jgi:hypothetical protein
VYIYCKFFEKKDNLEEGRASEWEMGVAALDVVWDGAGRKGWGCEEGEREDELSEKLYLSLPPALALSLSLSLSLLVSRPLNPT